MMHRRQAVRALLRTDASGVGNGVDQYSNLLPTRDLAHPMSFPREDSPASIHSEAIAAPEFVNPFADEPYFVSGPSDVASVIRSG